MYCRNGDIKAKVIVSLYDYKLVGKWGGGGGGVLILSIERGLTLVFFWVLTEPLQSY
jgi:hypothetical protein